MIIYEVANLPYVKDVIAQFPQSVCHPTLFSHTHSYNYIIPKTILRKPRRRILDVSISIFSTVQDVTLSLLEVWVLSQAAEGETRAVSSEIVTLYIS